MNGDCILIPILVYDQFIRKLVLDFLTMIKWPMFIDIYRKKTINKLKNYTYLLMNKKCLFKYFIKISSNIKKKLNQW